MVLYLSIVAWFAVAACCTPASIRLFKGKGGGKDATKWAFFLVSLLLLTFNFRWVFAAESKFTLEVLRCLGIALAFYLIAIVRFTRGDK